MKVRNFYILFIACISHTGIAQRFIDETSNLGIDPFMVEIQYGSGSNLVDVDQNGFTDVFILAGAGSQNLLYFNNGDSWSAPISIGNPDLNSRAAVWFDYNADHLLDVFILSDCANTSDCYDFEAFALFQNNGEGTFSDVSIPSNITHGYPVLSAIENANYSGGIAAGDLNLDGFLDLVVTRWGGELFFFENMGNGTFNNSSSKLGRYGLFSYWQPVIFNLDDDIWPEIYVAVDANKENTYLDKQITGLSYTDRASELGLHHKFNDMGITLGDFDNDLDFDIYISNIERFRDDSRNALFVNNGDSYYDEAINLGVDKGGWAWGVTFGDINNDGNLDLANTNGWQAHDLYRHDQSKMWISVDSTYQFQDFSEQVDFNDTLNASSLCAADIDRDGDIDIVQGLKDIVANINLRYLRNNLVESSCLDCNYITIKPRMVGQNHWGIGSTVGVKTSNGYQIRPITAGISFYGQEPAEAHFGIGNEEVIEEIIIKWPSGDSTIIYNQAANQIITVYDSLSVHNIGLVEITTIDTSTINLRWGHMSAAETQYLLQKSERQDFLEATEVVIDPILRTYTDENLNSFTDYYYRLKAINNTVESDWSDVYFSSTRLVAQPPINLSARLKENNHVLLEWKDTTNLVAPFELQRSLDSTFSSFFLIEVVESENDYIDQNLEPGFTYYYRIRLKTSDYIAPFSEVISISIPSKSDPVLKIDRSMTPIAYPNPSNGIISVRNSSKFDTIQIFSLNGKLIYSSSIFDKEMKEVSIETCGIYFLVLVKDKKIISIQKVIIEK